MTWLEGKELSAPALILEHLLPIAAEGLDAARVDSRDRDRYLGVLERRVRTGRTGSRWLMFSLAGMKDHGTQGERLNALTTATIARQAGGTPVAEWEPARLDEGGGWKNNYLKVEQYMETDVFTVHADESVDLVANMMEWEHIRYVPVEDLEHHLVGLVSQRGLLRLMASGALGANSASVAVADVMRPVARLITVSPETTTVEAIRLMREKRIGCLPVVHDNRLIGVVTERDFMDIAYELLERKLQE